MAKPKEAATADTAQRSLDVAERLVQTRGFNAFSYADVAAQLGITKPALHYHFAGKAELGEALLARYTTRFSEALETHRRQRVDAARSWRPTPGSTPSAGPDRMCLCGMLAADYNTLPEPMRHAVIRFFDRNETWLVAVIDQGRQDGTLPVDGVSREAAQMIIGTLEGAMLVARTYRDPDRFASSARRLLTEISAPTRRT